MIGNYEIVLAKYICTVKSSTILAGYSEVAPLFLPVLKCIKHIYSRIIWH